jgi:putative tributyrin esterase
MTFSTHKCLLDHLLSQCKHRLLRLFVAVKISAGILVSYSDSEEYEVVLASRNCLRLRRAWGYHVTVSTKISWRSALVFASLLLLGACHHDQSTFQDLPRLTPNVAMHDVSFHSTALNRDMPYRVILPKTLDANRKLPVVYLLHGGGGNYRDWSNYSDVARYAERGLVLVMPEGENSYYTNAAARPRDRYEDYIVRDLIQDVESRFPAATDRCKRAVIGVSMGGFGAVKLALKYPELFVFAGGLSSALDVPARPFSIKRIEQWRGHRAIFGPWQGPNQRENDPYLLAKAADRRTSTYLYLTCGEQEGLYASNLQFVSILSQRQLPFEFHHRLGGHNWMQWDEQLPACLSSLLAHVGASQSG